MVIACIEHAQNCCVHKKISGKHRAVQKPRILCFSPLYYGYAGADLAVRLTDA